MRAQNMRNSSLIKFCMVIKLQPIRQKLLHGRSHTACPPK